MSATVELLIWRASLETAPRIPRAIDLRDWAGVLAAAGETSGATLLEDTAALWQGFGQPAADASAWTVGIVLAELAALGRDFAPQPVAPPMRRVSGYPDEEGGIGPAKPPVAPPADLAAAAAALRAFLASPSCSGADAAAAETILASLIEARKRLPDLDYRDLRDAPLGELAGAIGLVALAGFALATRDLAEPPLGSIAFLHRTARLDPEALGPYLSGVGRVARKAADIFDLAGRAAEGGRGSANAWTALLARGCSGPLLMEIIDDLGDASRAAPLALILDRMLSTAGHVDLPLVRRIRDCGLDNADWRLAARGQAAIVRLRPQDYHEQVILGSIQATGGDYGSAEWTFRECLRQRPDDEDAGARLYAVRRNGFRGFEVSRGFETPADRQETRFRRRGILPDHIPRTGERITAVDVA